MNDQDPMNSTRQGSVCVFWLLIALGFAGFAPCVLLPEWRQYEALSLAEQVEAYRLEQLAVVVRRERSTFDAIRDDPAVMARLAQRELWFQSGDEHAVVVGALRDLARPDASSGVPVANMLRSGLGWTPDAAFVPKPVRPPSILATVAAALPALNYDAVFCDDDTRTMVMGMSLGLIVFAFAVFGGSAPRREARAPLA